MFSCRYSCLLSVLVAFSFSYFSLIFKFQVWWWNTNCVVLMVPYVALKMFVPKQQAAFIDVRALYIVRISYLACKLGNNRFELTWEINDTSNWNVLDLLKIEVQRLDPLQCLN